MPSDGILSGWGAKAVLNASVNLVASLVAVDVHVHFEIEREFFVTIEHGASGCSGNCGVHGGGGSGIGLVGRRHG